MLGITSIHSTVVRFQTANLLQGFAANGCETFLLIEETPFDTVTPASIARACADFDPDMIVMIDHLRAEYGPLLPQRIPFVCWIQDELPSLKTPEAIASLRR